MALYLIEELAQETAPRRLVKAKSDMAALKHAVADRYRVTLVTNPMDAADIAASGVKVENADAVSEPAATAVAAAQDGPPVVVGADLEPSPPTSLLDRQKAAFAA